MSDRVDARIRRIADWLDRFFHQPDLEISGTAKPRMLQPGFYESLPPIADAVPGAFARDATGGFVATDTEWVALGSAELTEAAIIAALGYTPADGALIGPILADIAALELHAASTANPHGVTKAQVGLSNVDNTSDLSKPISTATQTVLDGKQAASANLTEYAAVNPTAAGLALLDDANAAAQLVTLGLSATAAELNTLDGATVTVAEINKLDGLTPTTVELNFVDGVTSAIQTQLNGKADAAHNHPITTTIVDNTVSVAGGSTNSVSATCGAGTTMVGGGARLASSSASLNIYDSRPIANTWFAAARNSSGGAIDLVVYAVCLESPIA